MMIWRFAFEIWISMEKSVFRLPTLLLKQCDSAWISLILMMLLYQTVWKPLTWRPDQVGPFDKKGGQKTVWDDNKGGGREYQQTSRGLIQVFGNSLKAFWY
jgi:hypothetical protein